MMEDHQNGGNVDHGGLGWIRLTMWAPAILFWQFIVGVRTVPETECYVQFLSITRPSPFSTAIAGLLRACRHHIGTVLANLQGQQESREDGQGRALRTEAGEPVPTARLGTTFPHLRMMMTRKPRAQTGARMAKPLTAAGRGQHLGDRPTASSHQGDMGPAAHAIVTATKQPPKKKVAPSSREKKVTRTIMAILGGLSGDVDALSTSWCSSTPSAPAASPTRCGPSATGYCYINSTDQPSLLRPLQRHLQKDLQTSAALPVQGDIRSGQMNSEMSVCRR